MKGLGNATGAFADGAVLFPLLVALSAVPGMNGAVLLASAAVAYVAAGLVFRVPMPVQPLKSVAVAALALGASAHEIATAGALVGAFCLVLSFFPVDGLAARVPRHLVHGLQLALGLLLMWKGIEWVMDGVSPWMLLAFGVLSAAVLWASHVSSVPVMGWIASLALLYGAFAALGADPPTPRELPSGAIRVEVVVSLVLPQLALTLTNSVVGTQEAAERYFGKEAERVTARRLLFSIGLGNLVMAPLGGLPFCHGSGGVTAHVKGGARTWHMNLIIGGTLLLLAIGSWALSLPLVPAYPALLMAVLLFATGAFHLLLAGPSVLDPALRWQLVAMAITTVATQNMLYVLGVGVAWEIGRHLLRRSSTRPPHAERGATRGAR